MKIAILGKQSITAKDGTKYIKYSGFSESGESVEAFTTPDKDTLPDDFAPSKSTLMDAFDMLPKAVVEFNQRGRVETIQEVED